VPTSAILQGVLDEAPAGHFTLRWLLVKLRKRSFGIIMILLAIVATAPGVSPIAGLLLMVPALQMIAGREVPWFPNWIADRPLPARSLGALIQRAVPVLRYLERFVHPRWPTPIEGTSAPSASPLSSSTSRSCSSPSRSAM
jgi:hypothetical protein